MVMQGVGMFALMFLLMVIGCSLLVGIAVLLAVRVLNYIGRRQDESAPMTRDSKMEKNNDGTWPF
jgi:hypothetical protein